MKILVRGGGFENKGAEAMLRTVQAELGRRIAGAAFVADVKAREARAAAGAGFGTRADDVAAVVDISGFAYGDDWGEEPARKAQRLASQAEASGRPYVFLPQAWGPFEQQPVAESVRAACRSASAVYARDEESKGYLDGLLGADAANVHLAPDVAFRFAAAPPDVGARLLAEAGLTPGRQPLVGVVPNNHLYRRAEGEGTDNAYIRSLVAVVRQLHRRGAAVVLVPHRTFLDSMRPEDDRSLCRLVAEAAGRGGPLGSLMGLMPAEAIKSVIGHLDLLVGSRYHAIVAALACRVPAVVLSWSHKYQALMRLVGLESYVLDYAALDGPVLAAMIDEAYRTRAAAKAGLAARMPTIEQQVDAVFDHVAGLLLASRGRSSAPARPAAPAARDIRVPAADESVAIVRAATVEAVGGAGLCVGCGLCARVCPRGAVTVEETPGGLLRARVDTTRCTACGQCAAVCPGWHLEPGLLPSDADPFPGRVLAACIGQAADAQVLADGQSGGVVTALLGHLLATGRIGRALVTEMPRDGSLRARAFLAGDAEGLGRAQGSKYCPAPVCAALPSDLDDDGAPPVAVVGVGCHVHGLRNALARRPQWARGVALTVGLFCDRVLAFGAIDHLVGKTGLAAADAVGFEYRSKRWRGWPGDVRVLAGGGREEFLDRKHRMACKDQFTPARCRLCFDKFNVLADVAVGDAWGLAEDGRGASVVLARTPRGLEALASAERAGAVRLATVPAEAVFEAQRLGKRRAEWAAYTAAWKQIGGLAPDFGLEARHHEPGRGTSLVSYRRELRRAAAMAAEGSPAPAGVTAGPDSA